MTASIMSLKKELRKKMKSILKGLPEASAASQCTLLFQELMRVADHTLAAKATRTLLSLPEYQAAERLSIYLSMPGGEISTSSIVRDALNQGKKVFIPYIYDTTKGSTKSIMDMLELKSMEDFDSLKPDKWGIPTPSEDSIASRANCFGGMGLSKLETNGETLDVDNGLDFIVMPGMAFDAKFGRLGHGKGYYDYFLTRCCHEWEVPFRGKNYWYCVRGGGLTNHGVVGLALNEQFLPSTESVPMDSSDFFLDVLITGDGDCRRVDAAQETSASASPLM
jgi:5-formyltetrahydrofolate cyclo-ligase